VIIRVPTAQRCLERLLGPPTWAASKAEGAPIDGLIPGWTGVLLYLVTGGDGSGHVDLWNENHCRIDLHQEYARKSTLVEFWRLP
jgi:hypothetical protein